MADRMSMSQLGQALGGITRQAVHALAKRGMPIDSVEAAQAWRAANLDPSRIAGTRLATGDASTPSTAGASIKPSAPPAGDESTSGDDDAGDDYRRHRTERERINAERAQLELDELRGRLVDVTEVARLRFTEFRGLRDALGHIGARIKDACAVEADPFRVEQLITEAIEGALQAFADGVMSRGVTADADTDDDDDAHTTH